MAAMGFPDPPPAQQNDFLQKLLLGLTGTPANAGAVDPSVQQAAQRQALLALGSNLLAGSGPSPQRQSFGQILGPSLMAAQQANQQGIDSALQTQLMMSQIQRNKQKQRSKPIAVLKDGKPVYVSEEEAVGMAPYSYTGTEAKPAAPIQEYNLYTQQEQAAGRVPEEFMPWLARRAQYNVGAPYQQGEFGGARGAFNRVTGGFDPTTTLEQEAGAAGTIKAAETGAATTAEATAKAAADLPRVESNVTTALNNIKALRHHSGLPYITGLYSKAPIVPGTPQADADARAEQIQGEVFLQAYESLRGAQGITDVEGKKAEAAKARLKRATSTKDYQAALDDLISVFETGLETARKKAKKAQEPGSGPAGAPKRVRVDAEGNVIGN